MGLFEKKFMAGAGHLEKEEKEDEKEGRKSGNERGGNEAGNEDDDDGEDVRGDGHGSSGGGRQAAAFSIQGVLLRSFFFLMALGAFLD